MSSLADALRDPACYPHPVDRIELIETHISWILLTGPYAYKLKKPVALGFVDFTSLARRRHFCEEELRLNRRLAPALYLDVVPITGTPQAPRIGGDGEAIEYAVRMRQFAHEDLLDRCLAEGRLDPRHVDAIADAAAAFHRAAPAAPAEAAWGTPPTVLAPAIENFAQIEPRLSGNGVHLRLAALRRWTLSEHARLAATFSARRDAGYVRECHGDMHLGNMALVDGRPLIFDCIEFNPALRWIDVASECAFTVMDCAARGHSGLGWRFLNRYLEGTGDYGAVAVLHWYLVYRAMVRAKIDCIRARDPDIATDLAAEQWQDFLDRLALAERCSAPRMPLLAITCGPSGSGKTHATQHVLERCGAIRIRSDIERKRIHGYAGSAQTASPPGGGIYGPEATSRTFNRLGSIAKDLLAARQCVLVDATFLTRESRRTFRNVAHAAGARFAIICCHAPAEVARRRIDARRQAGVDASEANHGIYARQQQAWEPFAPDEHDAVIDVDTCADGALDALAARIESFVAG